MSDRLRGVQVDPKPGEVQIPVMHAEELPPPKIDGKPHVLNCGCHRMGMMRVLWDPYARTLVLLCAETGNPVMGVKVEKKNPLVLDPQRPGGLIAPESAH
jgi:hypothetical protein